MKIVNGIRFHTIELTDQAIATIHRLATMAMAPHQALLDEIARQLPQPPNTSHQHPSGRLNGTAPPETIPGEKPDLSTLSNDH